MIDNLFKFWAWRLKNYTREHSLTNLMTLSGYLFWAVRVLPQKSDNSVDCDEKLEQKAGVGWSVQCTALSEIYGRLFVARNEIKDIRNTGAVEFDIQKRPFVHRRRAGQPLTAMGGRILPSLWVQKIAFEL
jgi:hypothetical protein